MKEPSKNRMRLSLLIAALLIVLGAMLISTFRDMGVVNFLKLRNTEKLLRAEVEQLRRENAELKNQVEGLKSNPAVIEDEARKMGFIHEKEKVIIIP
ncbi:MAG: septum formation initiator family protein [Syntrophorhabdaceae bacterium]|nr:septum formation initiator family protein [Syntrophorhabdaceae bacterium]